MTREDTIKILSVLRGAYPSFYRDITKQEAESTIALWETMFDEEPYEIVAAAVKAFIAGDVKGFPPTIGQIKDRIKQIIQPEEMTEIEAWGLVYKALRNGYYGAQEEFDKLPPVIQRLVGSPNQLRAWSMMDTETVQSVVASNFQRSYRVRSQQERDWEKLPADVRTYIEEIAERSLGRLDVPDVQLYP